MSIQDFDLDTIKHFFEHDYHDRGMMKWQRSYLSDHTTALNQQKQRLNEVCVPRPQQSLAEPTQMLTNAYHSQQLITIHLKTVDKSNRHFPNMTTLIHSYNANDIVIDSDCFVLHTRNSQCSIQKDRETIEISSPSFLSDLFAAVHLVLAV